jgi:hypothetical protein
MLLLPRLITKVRHKFHVNVNKILSYQLGQKRIPTNPGPSSLLFCVNMFKIANNFLFLKPTQVPEFFRVPPKRAFSGKCHQSPLAIEL